MRRVFFSFHYEADNWRVQQIKNMGIVEGQKICSSNDWEKVKRNGDLAVQKWIDDNMYGKSCVVVLIGSETYGRKWVNYEIKKALESNKAIFGIYIHNLKDKNGCVSKRGKNPFERFRVGNKNLSNHIKVYCENSPNPYQNIKNNLHNWIERAIQHSKNR